MDLLSIITAFTEWSQAVASTWGYPGIFLINLVAAATILFPVPAFIIVFTFGAVLNPWLVGLAAALGATLGEFTGYGLGRAGEKAIEKKHDKWLKKANVWMEKYKAFTVIVFFAATPLPDDVVGVFCGAIKYDIRKFVIATFIGKMIMNLALALGGYYGMQWVLSIFGG